MSYPKTCKAWRRSNPSSYPLHLVQHDDEKLPEKLESDDVVIQVKAVSLNFRDIAMLEKGRYPGGQIDEGIVSSDCGAEVVAVGDKVSLKVGDHVSPIFNLSRAPGASDRDGPNLALGGDVEGVLAEYLVFKENVLVKLPKELSWEEASTIPCAAVTAWTALRCPTKPREDTIALLEGTGGVSLAGALICVNAGIRAIVTSSSDEKIEKLRKINPKIEGLNYKTHKDIAAELKRMTTGKGADLIVNNTGPKAVTEWQLKALRRHGTISMVGFLAGFEANGSAADVIMGVLNQTANIQGIAVGSKAEHEELAQFLADNKVSLKPMVDKVFSFDQAQEAFDYLKSGAHMGKVVIKL